MINDVYTKGLVVQEIIPSSNEINVDVNTEVRIRFNSDLNTKSIIGNLGVYKGNEEIVVKGKVAYEEKTIIFTPLEQLEVNSKYIVKMRGVKDILQNTLLEFESIFYTDEIKSLTKVEIIEPKFGSIIDTAPKVKWLSQNSPAYIIQVSKFETYEVLTLDKIINENEVDLSNIELTDGLYYIRVKAVNGSWSDSRQFFIKRAKLENAVVSEEDVKEDYIFEDKEEELEVLEYFPKEGEVSVSTKVNLVYVKVTGEIKIEDIDFNETYIVGNLFDEEDEKDIEPHDCVESKLNIVYDKENHESFIIFTPIEL